MEIDSEQVFQPPQFITYFDVSNSFPWRETRPEQIEQRRALLEDTLIFDLLLSSGGIKQPDALYPPTDVIGLQRLLEAIEKSNYDALKKESLVYYLLKWHQDGREERFQMDRCIPPHFSALADAYWYLDTGVNVPRAVSILSDARLTQEYASKIMQAISLEPNFSPLIIKYVRTARPALTDPNNLDLYTISLADASSFFAAWEFQRTFNEASTMRSRLFKRLLEWTVTPKPKPSALKQLLFLPLSQFEESLLRSYALESSLPPSSMAVLQDLVCVRLIQVGKYTEAIKTDHEFAASTSTKLKGLPAERTKMIQDLYSTLPSTERLLLDEELKQANKQQPLHSGDLAASTSGGDVSMSSSWEDVQIPRSPSPSHGKLGLLKSLGRDTQSSPKSLAERAQAARLAALLPKKPLADVRPPLIPATTPPNALQAVSKPVSRKSFPLPFVPPPSFAAKPRPRQSAGQVPTASTLEAPRVFPPLFMPPRPSPEQQPAPVNGTSPPAPVFSSANKTKNAFYDPHAKSNGMAVDTHDGEVAEAEAEAAPPSSHPKEDVDTEMADIDDHDHHEEVEENPSGLQFSIFGNNGVTKQSTQSTVSNGLYGLSPENRTKRKAVPPGAFLSDEDDVPEDEGEEDSPTTTRRSPLFSVSGKKPELTADRRKSKNLAVREVEQLKRSLPGTLVDEEDEEEDHVAPLRQPSPSRRTMRKGRSLASSDVGDEPEPPQTRRRSSRLSSQANVTSPESSPKKGSASARARKSTKVSSSAKKKR